MAYGSSRACFFLLEIPPCPDNRRMQGGGLTITVDRVQLGRARRRGDALTLLSKLFLSSLYLSVDDTPPIKSKGLGAA